MCTTCSPHVLQKEELLTKIYLYSVSGQEMIRKLPDFLVNIYVSGSVSPGAELRLATEEFMKGSHRADEYIRRYVHIYLSFFSKVSKFENIKVLIYSFLCNLHDLL